MREKTLNFLRKKQREHLKVLLYLLMSPKLKMMMPTTIKINW